MTDDEWAYFEPFLIHRNGGRSTPEAAPSPALGERSGAPSGLRPSTFVMSDTSVKVQFTSAGCLNYPCRTPQTQANSANAADNSIGEHFEFLRKSLSFVREAPLIGHGTGSIADLFRRSAIEQTGCGRRSNC
jgi:hypothetical protein